MCEEALNNKKMEEKLDDISLMLRSSSDICDLSMDKNKINQIVSEVLNCFSDANTNERIIQSAFECIKLLIEHEKIVQIMENSKILIRVFND